MKNNLFIKCILGQFIIVTFLFLIIGSSWALPVTIKIDPLQSYLVTDLPDDPAGPDQASPAIDLSLLNINPGDIIRLTRLGDFRLHSGLGEFDGMTGVFSSTNTILGLPSNPTPTTINPNRVSGAIDAGVDIVSELTSFSLLPTDISEDFLIGGNFTNVRPDNTTKT